MSKPNKKQIEDWKKEHGGVYAFPVDDKTAYLREPNMVDWKRILSKLSNGETAMCEEILRSLWLGGDEEIRNDDAYFSSAKKELRDFSNYSDAETHKVQGGNEIVIEGHRCLVRTVNRDDLKIAEKANPSGKPFVTQERLFDRIVKEKDEAYNDRNNASIRMPLYDAIEKLQNQKVAFLKKL